MVSLHVTSLPNEDLPHADSIFCGAGEECLAAVFKNITTKGDQSLVQYWQCARASTRRSCVATGSIVIAIWCPTPPWCRGDVRIPPVFAARRHSLKWRSVYSQTVDAALVEISRLRGRHLYFLDDHLFGNLRFAGELFGGMTGLGWLPWAVGMVQSVLAPGVLEKGGLIRSARPLYRFLNAWSGYPA